MLFYKKKTKRTHFGVINAFEKLLFSVEPGEKYFNVLNCGDVTGTNVGVKFLKGVCVSS